MLSYLLSRLVGIISTFLYLINFIFFPLLITFSGILRIIFPFRLARNTLDWVTHNVLLIPWIKINNFIMRLTVETKWDIKGSGRLRRKGKYFLLSNHQSWLDILVLHKVFGGRVPVPVFFIKKALIWQLPIVGFACWAVGFPFMNRYKKDYLKKHPEKKTADMDAIKKLCVRFKTHPMTIINFVEGTRFTKEKHRKQRSPYEHLLKPKSTGFASVLGAMKDTMQEIINVTIVYPKKKNILWSFVCGKLDKITVRYEVIPINEEWKGDYIKNREFRVQFHNKLKQLWQEKDELITKHSG